MIMKVLMAMGAATVLGGIYSYIWMTRKMNAAFTFPALTMQEQQAAALT